MEKGSSSAWGERMTNYHVGCTELHADNNVPPRPTRRHQIAKVVFKIGSLLGNGVGRRIFGHLLSRTERSQKGFFWKETPEEEGGGSPPS